MWEYRKYKLLRLFHLISKKRYKKKTAKYTEEYKAIAKSKLFNAKWYLKNNPDVKEAGLDPIQHYLNHGWKEGRECSPYFDGNQYLDIYPDVKLANICPLAHYVLRGKYEKRSIFPISTNVKHEKDVTSYKFQRYIKWLNKNNRKYEFVKITDSKCVPATDVKPIAFYLPQYHANDINNENFGRGFTEWTNVSQAIPYFTGHFQPHVPYDVGFYDLTTPKVMYRQVELAKLYGIYGFCFHYYWFSGKKVLEKPIQNWLNNKDLDLPFCLCWANENWSKLWDGGNREVFIEQNHSEEDDEKFFIDILPYFMDERYIKIQNKPLFVLYNAFLFKYDELVRFKNKLDELAQKHGFDGVYFSIIIRNSDVIDTYGDIADSLVEFPPHNIIRYCRTINNDNIYVHPNFTSKIYDIKKYVKEKRFLYGTKYKIFKGCFPSWDNSARKAFSNGYVFHNATPDVYEKWLSDCINFEENNNSQDERFVFINAWNEWGEGAHLEPDINRGYAYLQATKDALEKKKVTKILLISHDLSLAGASMSLASIAKLLKRKGYIVDFYSMRVGKLRNYLNENNINLLENIDLDVMRDYDLVICNTILTYDYVEKCKACNIPYIWYIREAKNITDFIEKNPKIEKTLLTAHNIVVVSEYAKKYLEKYNNDVRVVNNFVEDIYKGNDIIDFSIIGYFTPRKAFDVCIRAFCNLNEEQSNKVRLHIVGAMNESTKGYWFPLYENTKNQNNILWHNEIDGAEKDWLFRNTDVFIVPSYDESCSRVVLESCMYGKPCIVSENVGAKYMIDNSTGWICKTGDYNDLKAIIVKILNNEYDLKKMGEAARIKYLKTSTPEIYEKSLDTIIDFYSKKSMDERVLC